MKKINKFLILTFAVSLFGIANCDAQVYLKTPPPPKQTTRPPRNSKYEVWVPEDWMFDGNNKYVYRAGYWAFPPTIKSVYKEGYWVKSAKGYTRTPGYWFTPRR